MNDQQPKTSHNDTPVYPAYLPYRTDDEIDLFDLLETLWAGKLWILLFTTVMLGAAALYLQHRPQQLADTATSLPMEYQVTVPFTVNISPYWRHPECLAGNGAIDQTCISEMVLTELNADWRIINNKTLEMNTTSPQEVDAYADYFETLADRATKQAETTASADKAFINSDIPEALLGTEEIAQTALNAQRTLRQVAEGVSAVDFGPAEIIPAAAAVPTKKILLAVSIAGLLLGSLVVLIRAAYRKRQEERALSNG